MRENNKKLFRVIKEQQVVAILLAISEEECEQYILENKIASDLAHVNIVEVSKEVEQEDSNVIPLMVAKKFVWYDLRHYKHLYINQA